MSTDYTKDTQANPRRASAVPRDELHIDHPPRGIKMWRDFDGVTVIQARVFSSQAFFLLFLAWVSFASSSLDFTNLQNRINSGFDSPSAFWLMYCSLAVIASAIFTICALAYYFFGKCVIRVGAGDDSVFTGVGPVGKTRRFTSQSVKSIDLPESLKTPLNGAKKKRRKWTDRIKIVMDDKTKITLPELGASRETWLAFALEKILGLPPRETPNPPNHHA
jgi:hypothetical protein